MALIIEDGTLVDGANSYITTAELTTYLTDRGYTDPTTPEPLCIRAFDYMAGLDWIADHSQSYDVLNAHKNAQSEIAYRFSLGLDPSAVPTPSVKRKKIDILETEFFSNPSRSTPYLFLKSIPQAHAYLKDLILSSNRVLGRA